MYTKFPLDKVNGWFKYYIVKKTYLVFISQEISDVLQWRKLTSKTARYFTKRKLDTLLRHSKHIQILP